MGYLQYPDLAQGTHHFRVPLSDALKIIETLHTRIPLPKKTALTP